MKYFRLSHFLVGKSRVPGVMQIHVRVFFEESLFLLQQYISSYQPLPWNNKNRHVGVSKFQRVGVSDSWIAFPKFQ